MSFTVLARETVPTAQARRTAPGIAIASSRYTLGGRDNERYPLRLEIGLFPFKYNPNAKNLGEYMFRTTVMPIQIFTGGLDVIEMAGGYLTGAHLDGFLGASGFHWDAFYTINMDNPPLKSQNFTFMADYNMGGILEVGAGVQFQNAIHDRQSQVQPEKQINMSYEAADAAGGTRNFYYQFLNDWMYSTPCVDDTTECPLYLDDSTDAVSGAVVSKRIGFDNPAAGGNFTPLYTVTDSSFYSFRGTKVMGRAALNLAPALKLDMLGPRDLSFYIETILLGTQSVPVFAETAKERLPVMFGFNLPAFKLLDVLALEFEVLKLKYNTSNARMLDDEMPVYNALGPDENWDTDDWKFTIYAEKTIVDGFKLFGQVARDHLRSMDLFSKYDYEETTMRSGGGLTEFDWGDFYWMLKFKYMF